MCFITIVENRVSEIYQIGFHDKQFNPRLLYSSCTIDITQYNLGDKIPCIGKDYNEKCEKKFARLRMTNFFHASVRSNVVLSQDLAT